MRSLPVNKRPSRSELKGRITLIALCVLALTGVVVKDRLYPDPPVKGFCGWCGTAAHAVVP